MKKTTYALITLGVIIVLGIGVLIGLAINNNIKRMNSYDNNPSSNNVKEDNIENNDKESNTSVTPILDHVSDMQSTIDSAKDKINSINDTMKTQNDTYNDMINSMNTNSTNEENTSKPNPNTTDLNDSRSNIPYSSKDTDVIDTLKDTLNNIKNSEATEKFTTNAKKTFIDVVDFIFYGGTIKGHTFDELTDSGKAKVLEIASNIDDAIEAKVPGYKDKISSGATKAFNEASRLIKKGANSFDNFLQDKLSEESYNSIINAKDDLVYYSKNAISFVKDNTPKLFNTVKEKLSSWYQKYKNN